MHFEVDLDPSHSVIRLTVVEEGVSLESAEAWYKVFHGFRLAGGPYAVIHDPSMAKRTTIPTQTVGNFGRRTPSIPTGKPHVIVGETPVIYGLARLFQMCEENVGREFDVVHTLEEAYDLVGVRPGDFTERLYPEILSAA